MTGAICAVDSYSLCSPDGSWRRCDFKADSPLHRNLSALCYTSLHSTLEPVYVCIQVSECHLLMPLEIDLEIVRKIITADLIPSLCLSHIYLSNLGICNSISATHLHPWKLDKPHDDFLSNGEMILTDKIYHFPLTCEEKVCFLWFPWAELCLKSLYLHLGTKTRTNTKGSVSISCLLKNTKWRLAFMNNVINRPRLFNTHLLAREFDLTSTFWVRFSMIMLISTINSKQ